jgi:hypothetical protein
MSDALRVGGDAREVGAVEDRALQGPRLQQRLFRLLARGVVGADQEVADDGVLRVAQRRDRHHGREAAPVLADIGQLVDIFDPARRFEHQGLEARRNRGAELDAERLGARDHFLRIGNVGRRNLVHHLGGRVAQHPFGADVEDLDDALCVGGDARKVCAVEDRTLQGPRLQQRLCAADVGVDFRRGRAFRGCRHGSQFLGPDPDGLTRPVGVCPDTLLARLPLPYGIRKLRIAVFGFEQGNTGEASEHAITRLPDAMIGMCHYGAGCLTPPKTHAHSMPRRRTGRALFCDRHEAAPAPP